MSAITDNQFNKERISLGIAEGTRVSFGHTHLLGDYKNDHPYAKTGKDSPILLKYGSDIDATTVVAGELGGLTIGSYVIYAPIKQSGWGLENLKIEGWNREKWPQ